MIFTNNINFKKPILFQNGSFLFKAVSILVLLLMSNYSSSLQNLEKAYHPNNHSINTQNTNMIDLSLVREEREPIRESYFRTYVYLVKDGMIYCKRYSWGRISENKTDRFKLSAIQLDLLQKALNNSKFKINVKEFSPEADGNIQLNYKLNLISSGQEIFQHFDVPANHFNSNQEHIDRLWKLLANFQPKNETEIVHFPKTEYFNLNLSVKQTFCSKDTEIKTRKYSIQGNKLTIEQINEGRFRAKEKTIYQINDKRLHQIIMYITQAKEFEDGEWFNKTSRAPFSYLFPRTDCEFRSTINDKKYAASISGDHFSLLRSIPFITIEHLEKLLDSDIAVDQSKEKELSR